MVPSANNLKDVEMSTTSSLDYKMDLTGKHVTGTCNGLEAVKQAIFCILNTERYKYPVYSWNYGIELSDLFGQPKDYVIAELPRRITEALMQDDRISSVDNFELDAHGKIVTAIFTVHTIFGDTEAEKRLEYV